MSHSNECDFCLFSPFIIGCPSLEASQFHLCTHKCTAEREATQSPNESSQSRALHHTLRLGHKEHLSAFSLTLELGGTAVCRKEENVKDEERNRQIASSRCFVAFQSDAFLFFFSR